MGAARPGDQAAHRAGLVEVDLVAPAEHHAVPVVRRAAPVGHHAARAAHQEARVEHHAARAVHQEGRVAPRVVPAGPDRLALGQAAVSHLAHPGAALGPCPAARSRTASTA